MAMSSGVVRQLVRMSAGRIGVRGRASWLSDAEKTIKLRGGQVVVVPFVVLLGGHAVDDSSCCSESTLLLL
jgi:sirohydrochlorin ferrochelatase